MKIKFDLDKKKYVWFIIMMVAATALLVRTRYHWWIYLIFAVAYFLIKAVEIELSPKIPWVWTGILFVGGAILTTFCIQFMLLDDELFYRTTYEKLYLNVLCCLVLYLLVQLFVNNTALSCGISHVLLLVLGFSNYFVYSFRGNELTFADMRSIGTGLSVAGNYSFKLSTRCSYVILITILFIGFVRSCKVKFERPWIMRLLTVLLITLCGVVIVLYSFDTNTETWEQKGTYRNGYVLNFVLQIRDSIVTPPKGYSVQAVEELGKKYKEADSSRAESDVEKPTVIVIMNESFADLAVLGPLVANEELTPFFDSLSENTIKGYALSSVFAAKTPNSEWEFQTGNSMAFLPDGSVVYQQYIDKQPNSIVSTFKNNGYTCVAMHPYYETGWSRNKIYPTMGYDEMYFIDHFDQTKLMRNYITDAEMYDKIIDRFESRKKNENLYLMGITMQNHGGYGEDYENFPQYVYKMGTSYTDVNQYLQLVKESDNALEDFVKYFQNVDEPVEIVFFGDHQPGLNSKFYQVMNGKGLGGLSMDELEDLYTVPFFIWTNYETEAKKVDMTSLNFLSTMALERANIDLPPYNQFLADMMEKIPAVNSRGYYSLEGRRYKHLEEANGEEAKWISNYKILQYNNMFGKSKRNDFFFPYLNQKARH